MTLATSVVGTEPTFQPRRKHVRFEGRSGRSLSDDAASTHGPKADIRERLTFGSMEGLGRVQRTDGDVVPVKISERKLRGSSAGIDVWLFFQPADKGACPWQS
jgi:hypothetical protein